MTRRIEEMTQGYFGIVNGRILRVALLACVAWVGTAHAAQEACTPEPGFNKCVRFTNASADQSFTVPAGVASVGLKLWGAGGGGGSSNSGWGGGGGFASGTLPVTPGSALTVIVGSHGAYRSTASTYGGGGAGGNDSTSGNFDGASGGGRSAVRVGGTEQVTAAGGGGSAGATVNASSQAGAGGQDARWGSGTSCHAVAATAGTTTAGGTGGRYDLGDGTTGPSGANGSAGAGGAGGGTSAGNTGAGGGGGGGYFGGGGGAAQVAFGACQEGSGAGGSNYTGGVTSASAAAGNNQTPANTSDAQYVSGAASGGYANTASLAPGHGLVVIQYRVPTIQVSKQAIGATGTFSFTGTNGYGSDTITVSTAGTTVAGAVKVLDAANTATVLTEAAPPAGFVFAGATCTGLSGGATPVVDLVNRTVTLPAAGLQADATVACTFINRTPLITLSKALSTNRFSPGDNFSVAIRTGGVNGAVVSSTAAATTTGSGATIDPGTGTTGIFAAAEGTTYTLTEAGTGGALLSNYIATLTCTDVAGVTPAGTLPTNEAFDPAAGRAITPVNGADLRCTITNASRPKITLQKSLGGTGRLSASDQFVLSGTGAGAPAGVTTTGSGIAVTSPAYSFTGTAGSAYTLNEAMAPGSASALSAYTQAVSCGNAGGPTDVSGITTLPISFTAAAGDNISCVVTNYPTTAPGGGPGPNPGPVPICNADPVIAGTNFSGGGWARSGWTSTGSTFSALRNSGPANQTQVVNGVTPGALLTFNWNYGNGTVDSTSSTLTASYGPTGAETVYWTATINSNTGTATGSSAASNGAACVSGCGSAPNTTSNTVQLRLPPGIPMNGTLRFTATGSGGTGSPYIATNRPVSIQNTGICLAKNSLGTTGTFNFTTSGVDTTMGGGGTTASITTAAVNTTRYYDASATRTNNQPLLITSPGATANVTINETPATGFVLDSVSCPGLSPVRTGNTVTIANVPRDTVTTCTFTNRPSVINLSKALSGNRVGAGDQFSVAIRTGGATGPIVSSPVSATTTGSGATIAPGTGTTDDFYTVPGTLYTLMESGTSGANLANYNASLTCTDATGLTPASSLPSNEPFNPAIGRAVMAATGANLRCVITNSAGTPTITGRVFLDNGQGSGTANDGLLNGGEVPQAGITLRLTNCAATVYATAVTNAVGGYSLSPPMGTASGTALCVEELNASGHTSTGASASGTALPSGSATAVAGTSYTYTRTGAGAGTGDRIAFAWNGTGHTSLDFGDVPNATFAANGAKNGLAGTTVSYGHTFTAGTAGAVRFSIASETATPTIAGWTAQVFADTSCTGSLQPGAAQLYPPAGTGAPVATGGQVCIIVRQFIPATATTGANNKLVVQADFDYANATPSLAASYVLEDTTTVGSQALDLKKEVRNVTQGVAAFGVSNQAKPGETLEYRITYTNNSAAPISSMTVNDTTPSYTSFVGASAGTTPATLTSCTKNTPGNALPAAGVPCASAQAEGGTGPIEWRFVGTVQPGGTGWVLFRVKVD
jgi:uncharacterized repeat protein (TIGR01451 family)